jgi:enoyl-CoA hydratase/carnithine racemase
MPTIALINGHCFAAGIMTAMMHDYRVMNPHKGFIATNELDFGAPMRPAMLGIFRMKLPRPDTLRTMILEAKRFPALEALKEGLVDMLGGAEEVLALIKEKKLVGRADTGVYGVLKEEMWRETVQMLDDVGPVELAKDAKEAAVNRKWVEKGQRNVAEFEAQQRSGKAKL